ncbi:MAG TPA: hydrogenase maturation protease [Sedimentisphaerales bacterium]|jgi:hydrogenase maturation protease|nr:hydrogenase maturation protease [Sedimentisphaerales bacterium]HNU28164.1 hydrogenase maturation protease [Sedimentisphaerales bacterium]
MASTDNPSSIRNNQSTKRPTVVLGLGNPLMADEGIGVCLVERLAESLLDYPDVDFLDAGTGGLAVLHHMAGRRKAILVDCAYMEQEPGAIRRFSPDDVRSKKVLAHQSLHDADLLRIIGMARELGQAPEEIVIFGIQPELIEFRQGLSVTLANGIDRCLAAIRAELDAQ